MNIAIIRLYCGKSGEKGFYNMQELGEAKAYSKRGISVYIILLDTQAIKIEEQKETERISILRVPARRIMNHGIFECSVLTKYKINLVQLQSDNQMYAPAVMQYCEKHYIPFYNYIGTLYSDSNHRIKRAMMKILTRRNIRYYRKTPVFCKNAIVQQQLAQKGVIDCTLAPVGLDLDLIPEITETKEQIREQLNLPKNKKILLFVGRLEAYKNPVAAVRLLASLDDRFFLIMIGQGRMKEEVLKKASELHVDLRMRYIEKVPNKDIHHYYKACDNYINLNPKEIFGMSILEAMYNGCTVVAIKAPGPVMILEDKVSGYLVKDMDEMRKIILERDTLPSIIVKKRVIDNFIWERTVDIFLNTIEQNGWK